MVRKSSIFWLFLGIVIVRFSLARLFPNVLWADEIFQTLEQAHRLVFGYGIIPWEFRDGVRNWILPGFLSFLISLGSHLGYGSFGYSCVVDLFFCLLSLLPIYFLFHFCAKRYDNKIAILVSLAGGLWHYLVFFSSKALYEVTASHIFFGALLLYDDYPNKSNSKWRFLFLGTLLGLVFVLRMHYAFAVAVLIGSLFLNNRRAFYLSCIGFLFVFLAAGALDAYTWGTPFQSFWLYFDKNIIQGVSKSFGVSPWYTYFAEFSREYVLALPFIVLLAVLGSLESPMLFLVFFAVLIPHSIIEHKEMRFVYLSSLVLIILALIGTAFFLSLEQNKKHIALLFGMWFTTSLALGLKEKDRWFRDYEHLVLFRELSLDKEMCGLGIYGINWTKAGGFYNLHQNIQVYYDDNGVWEIKDHLDEFNRLIVKKELYTWMVFTNFKRVSCVNEVCLYHRAGICRVKKS